MRKTIKDSNGKVLGVWVARTIRGFNQKQKAEMEAVRATADAAAPRACGNPLAACAARCTFPLCMLGKAAR